MCLAWHNDVQHELIRVVVSSRMSACCYGADLVFSIADNCYCLKKADCFLPQSWSRCMPGQQQ